MAGARTGGGDPATSPARVKALEGLGWLLQYQGEYGPARAAYEEMLELARTLEDKANATTALNSLGTVAMQQGDTERARAYLQENLEALEKLEEEVGTTATTLKRFHALNLLGYLAIAEEGDYARGATLWEESLALAREAGDTERIRVRKDHRKTGLRNREGTIAHRWGNPGYPALDVLLDEGYWELFWYHELEPVDKDDIGARRQNGATAGQ